jgi:NADPH:quinone reductase
VVPRKDAQRRAVPHAHSTFPVRPGHTVLIHAGADGLGLLLTQVVARRGATVLTTTSSDEKAARSRAPPGLPT